MDQRLLLKEKDYELLHNKRIVETKHSFHDPLINPLKGKSKKTKNQKEKVENKPVNVLANNVLDRRGTKTVRSATVSDAKMVGEEEMESKVEITPWRSILNLFLKSYDMRKESLDLQVANVPPPTYSLLAARASKPIKALPPPPASPPPAPPPKIK
jgi:hypothetical protein